MPSFQLEIEVEQISISHSTLRHTTHLPFLSANLDLTWNLK